MVWPAVGRSAALAGIVALGLAACGPAALRPPLPPPPHPGARGPSVAAIVRTGALRVASDLSDPPLAFREGTAPRGLEIDLAELLAASLGVRLEVRDTPGAILRGGFSGADLMMGAMRKEEVPGPASESYYTLSQGILWGGREAPVRDHPLRNVRVAVQVKSPGETLAGQMGAGPILAVYLPAAALAAVSRGEVQGAVADLPVILDYARTHRGLTVMAGPWAEAPLVVGVRPDGPDLLVFVSAAIRELEHTGGLAQLRQRWHL
ncbi:MAG: amino acid ABC transporter substrate-binding protein [Bacillati bacterium ANGP1]|uniref:Amino acid ABC transporter substrate-binding protein n=1 Tax=Candidatus Segetimicrobium genomatis TaxID=2569760 RepID=A0A537JVI8_9BACT|nr:MAG: amino acid ABC transporter substrate-binding protein [Terrabacteria group bacterium ANGP1]